MTGTGAWVDQTMRRHPGDLIAFAAVMIPGRNDYGVGVAVLGEAGYLPTEKRFPSYEEASAFCDEANPLTGLSEKMSTLIIMDTMRRSQTNRDKADGFVTVRLHIDGLRELATAYDDGYLDLEPEGVQAAEALAEAVTDYDSESQAVAA